MCALLSDDERARHDRVQTPLRQRRFAVAHAALRILLAAYLGRAPQSLRFSCGSAGKPRLDDVPVERPVDFSLSHSEELAVIAVSARGPLGADVEFIRPRADSGALAERYFSPRERQALAALPAHEREAAFYTCWTRKEAFIKATGAGLSVALDSFDVTVGRDKPARLIAIAGRPDDAAAWSLHHWEPAAGYVAATALHGRITRLGAWTIDVDWLIGAA